MAERVQTARLELVPLSVAWHEAALAGEPARCAELLGAALGRPVALCPEWAIPDSVLRLRCEQLRGDPSLEEWLLRAIVLRESGLALGHIGFHTRPAPDYLAEWCPEGVELGYLVSPPHRRRGYAREAALGLMDWATRQHGVDRFVACVAPDNAPSQALVRQLGFVRVGAHEDDEHGVEEVLVREAR